MSNHQGRLRRHFFLRWLLMSLVAAMAVGCGDTELQQISGQPPGNRGGGGGTSFAITAPGVVNNAVALDIGQTLQFSGGAAQQSVAGQLVLAQAGAETEVEWSSSNPSVASITNSGLLTARAAGQADVSATVNGRRSSNTIRVTVRGAEVTLQSISIAATPSNTSNIAIGSTVTFVATGTFSDGSTSNITNSVTWGSSNTTVGANPSSTGVFTASAAGSTNITAARNGRTSNVIVVTVQPAAPTLEDITLDPAGNFTLYLSYGLYFTATGHYSDGSTADLTASVTWSSTDPNVGLPPDANGFFDALNLGSTEIRASLDDVTSDPTTVTVRPVPTLQDIVITFTPVGIVEMGQTAQFTATGFYSNGIDIFEVDLTASVTWTSTDETVGIPDSDGLFVPQMQGWTTIGASYEGVDASTPVSIDVVDEIESIVLTSNPPPSPPPPPPAPPAQVLYLFSGETATFTATANFVGGGSMNVTEFVTWNSSNPSAGEAPSSTGEFTALQTGQSTDITATRLAVTSDAITVIVSVAP